MNHTKQPSLQGIYFISLAATIIGIGVIIILDLATPLAYMQGRLSSLDQSRVQQLARLPGGTVNLAFLLLLSCPLLLLIRKYLHPLHEYFNLLRTGRESEDLLKTARQRLINLPFILIPINLCLWFLLPSALYYAAHATGYIDARTAITLAVRAIMVGFLSAGFMSLWIEAYARRRLIQVLFPRGRLTEVKGVARYSISRRIRLHNRL